ncbi:MAG: hypothetical protein WAV20_01140 [Blastocatellia bacterium]
MNPPLDAAARKPAAEGNPSLITHLLERKEDLMDSVSRVECVARESLSKIEQTLSRIQRRTGNQWLAPAVRNVISGFFLIVSVCLPIYLQKIDAKVQGNAEMQREESKKRTAPFRRDLFSSLTAIDRYVDKVYLGYAEKTSGSYKDLWSKSLEKSLNDFAKLIERPEVDVQQDVIDALRSYQTFIAGIWDDRMRRLRADERKQIYDESKALLEETKKSVANWH